MPNKPDITVLPSHHGELMNFNAAQRGLLARLALKKNPPPENTTDILAVGGFYNLTSFPPGLSARDSSWLGHTIKTGRDAGLLDKPYFRLLISNIADGVDFLDPSRSFQTNGITVNYILDPLSEKGSLQARKPEHGVDAGVLISPFHTSDRSWLEAAERTNAEWVVVFSGDEGDISGRHFEGGRFLPVISKQVEAPPESDKEYPMVPYKMDVLVREDRVAYFASQQPSENIFRL